MEKTAKQAQVIVQGMVNAGIKMKDIVAGTGVNPTTLGWIRKGRTEKISEKTFDRIWEFWSKQPISKEQEEAPAQESVEPDARQKLEEARAIVHDLLNRGMTTTDVAYMSAITARTVRDLREALTDEVSDRVYSRLQAYYKERTGETFVLGVHKDKAGKHKYDIDNSTRSTISKAMYGRKTPTRKQWSAPIPEKVPVTITTNLSKGDVEKTVENAREMVQDLLRAGISGLKIAEGSGVSSATVANIRNGRSTVVRAKVFDRIRDYWLKSVEWKEDSTVKTTMDLISHDHVPVNADAMKAIIERLIGNFEAAVKELASIRKELKR
ncbi:hypothetical protein KQI65_01885 [bacterium]|nr:hypothetical protein [bacterium]